MATIKFTISAAPTRVDSPDVGTAFTYETDVTDGTASGGSGAREITVEGPGIAEGTTVKSIKTFAASGGVKAKVRIVATGDVLPRGEYSYEEGSQTLEYTGMSDSQVVAVAIRANLVKVVAGLTNSLAAAVTNLKADDGGPVNLGNFATSQKYFRALENTSNALAVAPLTPDGIEAVNVPDLDEDSFEGLPEADREGVEVMRGSYVGAPAGQAVMGIEGILRELSTDDKIFQDFLIYGKTNEDQDNFFGDDAVTRELYNFLQRLTIALFIDTETDAGIDNIKANPPYTDIPTESQTWQDIVEVQIADVREEVTAAVDSVTSTPRSDTAPPAEPAPAPVQIDKDAVKATVDKMLDEFTNNVDNVLSPMYSKSKFAVGKEFNDELDGYVVDIKANNKEISYKAPLGSRATETPDKNALSKIQQAFPGGFQEKYEDPNNIEFKKFLDEGKSEKLQDPELQRLYKNLLGFATVLGVETQVANIVQGSETVAASPPASSGAPAAAGGTAPEAAPSEGTAAAPAAPSELSAPAVDRGTVPTERQTSADTILFRYTLFGVKPDTEPTMRIVFNDANANDYTISKELVGSFQSFVVNGADRERFKQNVNTYATVKITAIPAGGGDAVTQENQVFIPASLTDDMVYAFRFTPSRGWTKNTGEAVGNRQAGRISNPQGEVYCVFWTVSGGVAEGAVDAQARVSGKTYTLTFAGEPLLVPVVIPIIRSQLKEGKYPHKTTKKLLKEAVPHWIFLSPGGDGAGAAGPGGRGRGGGRAGRGGRGGDGAGAGAGEKENVKVNIAISKLTFTTTGMWVTLPNTGNIVSENNFSFDVASRKGDVPDSALSVTLDKAGLKAQGYDDGPYNNVNSVVGRAVFETLFLNSEAWRQVGGASLNCWIKDSTVVGTFGSITTREGYTPV